MNTPSDATIKVTNSACYKENHWFTVKELRAETGMSLEMAAATLLRLMDSGRVSKHQFRRCERGGRLVKYQRVVFKARDYIMTSYRRHTNEELGLEPLHCWSVL